jgi:hypothetical protein
LENGTVLEAPEPEVEMMCTTKPLPEESEDSKDQTAEKSQQAEKAPPSTSVTVERTPLSKEFRTAVRRNINIGKSFGIERKKLAGV